jgi:hypothetical protein
MRAPVIGVALALCASFGRSADRWEAANDDTPATENVLRHGTVQTHDLEPATGFTFDTAIVPLPY